MPVKRFALVGLLLLVSCQPSKPQHEIGVGRDSAGALFVQVATCNGSTATRILLTRPRETFQSADDPVLWNVSIRTSEPVMRLAIGQPPPVGAVNVALSVDLDGSFFVLKSFDSSNSGDYVSFKQSMIKPGKVLIGQKVVDESEFLAARNCPNKK